MRKVLLVDDSRLVARLLESLLKSSYIILGHGRDGNEGFEMYKSLQPDLVLLDVTMPNCDGRECLQKIMAESPAAKVIMVTSLSDRGTIDECLQLGAIGYICKDMINAKDLAPTNPFVTKVVEIESQALTGVAA